MYILLVNLTVMWKPCAYGWIRRVLRAVLYLSLIPVSYTHLDVYKRQGENSGKIEL